MRWTYPTAVVLTAIANGHAYGFDVVAATGLRTGTVYPILRRLEAEKLVRSAWEPEAIAREEARQPRRNYRLTAAGLDALQDVLARHGALAAQHDPARGSGLA